MDRIWSDPDSGKRGRPLGRIDPFVQEFVKQSRFCLTLVGKDDLRVLQHPQPTLNLWHVNDVLIKNLRQHAEFRCLALIIFKAKPVRFSNGFIVAIIGNR